MFHLNSYDIVKLNSSKRHVKYHRKPIQSGQFLILIKMLHMSIIKTAKVFLIYQIICIPPSIYMHIYDMHICTRVRFMLASMKTINNWKVKISYAHQVVFNFNFTAWNLWPTGFHFIWCNFNLPQTICIKMDCQNIGNGMVLTQNVLYV